MYLFVVQNSYDPLSLSILTFAIQLQDSFDSKSFGLLSLILLITGVSEVLILKPLQAAHHEHPLRFLHLWARTCLRACARKMWRLLSGLVTCILFQRSALGIPTFGTFSLEILGTATSRDRLLPPSCHGCLHCIVDLEKYLSIQTTCFWQKHHNPNNTASFRDLRARNAV